jgi:DNA-binding transcriptional LysR family regulator
LPEAIDASEIEGLGFVAPPHDLMRERLVRAQLREAGAEMGSTVLELGHAEAMKRAVREEAGVAFVFAASAEEELTSGALREISIKGLKAPLVAPVCIAHRDVVSLSPLQRDLVEMIRQEIGGIHGERGSSDESAIAAVGE